MSFVFYLNESLEEGSNFTMVMSQVLYLKGQLNLGIIIYCSDSSGPIQYKNFHTEVNQNAIFMSQSLV